MFFSLAPFFLPTRLSKGGSSLEFLPTRRRAARRIDERGPSALPSASDHFLDPRRFVRILQVLFFYLFTLLFSLFFPLFIPTSLVLSHGGEKRKRQQTTPCSLADPRGITISHDGADRAREVVQQPVEEVQVSIGLGSFSVTAFELAPTGI